MRFNASSDACSSDVLIEMAEPRRVLSGPVTGAAVSGVCLALVTAALIYVCHRKQVMITAAFEGVRRRTEACEESDSESHRTQHTEPAEADEPPLTVNSDVAVFALKARVVYPINQRYRPLADGASNPSLHEPSKHLDTFNQDSASSSGDDWPSQERDNDDSSQFILCSPASKAHARHVFKRVQHYPQTLSQSRVSLLCLTLQELQLHTAQLQQEKYRIYLHIVKVLLGDGENADVIHAQQQQEVEELKRGVSADEGAESDTVMCSVEDVEKTGREQLEHALHTAVCFVKQLERLHQTLHCKFSSDVTEEVMHMLMRCLRLVESGLAEIQASVIKTLMNRFEWWEEVSDWLRERTALLKQEAELIVKLTGQSMKQLRVDGQLMEKLMSEFETSVHEVLQQSTDEVRRQSEELSLDRCQQMCLKRRKMMKSQSSDCSRMLSNTQTTDTKHIIQVFMELQVRQWNQRRDFELQQDARITDALYECWTSLFGDCSRRFTHLWTEFVLSNIPAGSAPTTNIGQSVLKSMKQTVTSQMQQERRHAHTHLHMLREQLQRRRQVWIEEEALTRSCLNHFGEQQCKVVMAMVSRHPEMQKSCALIEEQQQLLLLEFQRILSARHFYLRTVREMKLTELNTQSETQDPCVCVAMAMVPPEVSVIGQNVQHEHLSELETAADMLQGHAHFLVGHVLSRIARLQMSHLSAHVTERLIDAACESVYVTRDSVLSLVREYYSRIQCIVMSTQQQLRLHTSAAKNTEAHTDRKVSTEALHTQLNNWARKPNSTELHHRVSDLKRKCLATFEKEHHSPVLTHTYRQQLRDEEEAFMCRLAALARVSLNNMNKEDFTGSEVRDTDVQIVT
ncbi:evC complex member EVC [Myxocyprinus asiaticus]|uniref:evC complex member EVC n=1 Tax=Myxocyprinus asiaticus TaxID=70543 RepID=UPI0022216F62|nr:evC complex member EVC [Myxocyprinus asiaticus]